MNFKHASIECVRIIVSKGKFDFSGRDEELIVAHNQVKAKMQFEKQAKWDLDRMELAISKHNTDILEGIISAKILRPMLEFYAGGYKI